MPEKIACSVLVSPAGLKLGSKLKMMQQILLPILMLNISSSQKHLQTIADVMSSKSMKEIDKNIIGEIFKYVKLEQDMPKITEKNELINYFSPTLIVAGNNDIFFSAEALIKNSKEVTNNLETRVYNTAHFPDQVTLVQINNDIKQFLSNNY